MFNNEDDYNTFITNIINKKTKIITLIREPLSRKISGLFQILRKSCPDAYKAIYLNKGLYSYEKIKPLLDTAMTNDGYYEEFAWFNTEFRQILDVDVYEYPFDKEKGYSIIKQGNIEILLMKLEKLNNLEDVIGEFVGVENFKLTNANEGKNKPYSELYREAKEKVMFNKENVDYYYRNNAYMDHFYNEEEKLNFLRKMEKNLPDGYIDEYIKEKGN